ncbi:MAG: hypothetical protein ACR2NZ_12680 [Rubripirellula sp.]
MNTPDPNPTAALSDAQKNECLQYLMGELNPSESQSFERQLASSTALGDELLRQAEGISLCSQPDLLSQPICVGGSANQVTRWRSVAALLAVAVCLAVLVFGVWPKASDKVASRDRTLPTTTSATQSKVSADQSAIPEDVLIARAWASNRLPSDSGSDGNDSILPGDEIDVSLASLPADGTEMDSTLSWMYIAVAGDLEEANDG